MHQQPRPARPVRDPRLPGPVSRPDPAHRPRRVAPGSHRHRSTSRAAGAGRSSPRCPPRTLRSTSTASRSGRSSTRTGRRVPRHPSRRRRDDGRLRHGALVWRLHDEPAARGPDGWQGVDRVRVRRGGARARARRPRAPAGPASLLLEEREVGAGARTARHHHPGFWEGYGYHNYGDPWREQRYSGD